MTHTTTNNAMVIFVACITIICAQAGIVMYVPSIPVLSNIFNVGYTAIAYTLTAYLLGYAIAVLFVGGISDHLGRKKIYLITITIFSFSSILLAFTSSIYMFILLRFFQGIGGGGCAVNARASIRDVLEGKKLVSAMSYLSISFIISMGIFQYVGGIIQEYANYKYDFILMCCLSLIILLLIIFKFKETHQYTNGKFEINNFITNYKNILMENYLIILALGGGIGYSILIAFNVLGVYYLQNYLKVSPQQIGIIGAWFSIVYLLGSFFVNKLGHVFEIYSLIKFGKTVVFLGGIFSVVTVCINKYSYIWIVIPLLVSFIGQAILYPCVMVKAIEPYKRTAGAASSLFGFTQQFAGFLISMLIGNLSYQHIFSLSVVAFVVGLISFLLLSERFLHQRIDVN